MRRPQGFTLVELLVTMAVLMIISAIAVPHYLSALQRGHEAVAVSFLRQVQTSQEAYRLANQEYADTFIKLQPYMSAQLVSPPSPGGNGYIFATVAFAAPLQQGKPPGQGGTPPGRGGTPPGQGGTPPGQGGTPPGRGGTPPGQAGTPPGGGGVPTADTKVYSMYIFKLTRTDPSHWGCTAEPVRDRLSNRFFYTDETNIIHVSIGSLADALSPQI